MNLTSLGAIIPNAGETRIHGLQINESPCLGINFHRTADLPTFVSLTTETAGTCIKN
jgi:hypothetical protein